MSKFFKNSITGEIDSRPWDKQQALDYNHPTYRGTEHCGSPYCNVHGSGKFVKHTATDKCVSCLKFDQIAMYNYFNFRPKYPHWDLTNWTTNSFNCGFHPISDELTSIILETECLLLDEPGVYKIPVDPCRKGGHIRLIKNGKCVECERQKEERRNTPRRRAIDAGEDWYTPDEPCEKCNVIAPRHVSNGRCKNCIRLKSDKGSPRQNAIRKGKKWYIPDAPCERCNTISPKRVNNGECKGCIEMGKEISPRKKAMLEGRTWYTPDKDCLYCGTRALKRIHDGRCQECNPILRPEMSKM